MPKYKILGIFSFAENVRKMKLDDQVILKKEEFNIKSKNAIGIYSLDNKKLGYLPTESTNEIENFNSAYKICTLALNKEYPLVEISRYYSLKNYLLNVEYPFEKKIKYDYKLIDITKELRDSIIKLEKYLSTKRIKVKRSAIIYYDENYINILLEVSKGVEQFQCVTSKYFKDNIDRYEELYDNNLINNTFYRELLVYRLECYYENNYTHILKYPLIFDIKNYNIIEENIYDPLDINSNKKNFLINKKKEYDYLLLCKLYLRYLVNNNDYYISKYLETDDIKNSIKNIFINYKVLNKFMKDYKLAIGNFIYDHKLKIYEYIDFINTNTVFVISDNFNYNYLYLNYLTNKENLIIYNPFEGKIYKINDIKIKINESLL